MGMRTALLACMGLGLAAAMPARAAVVVIGSTMARDCFLAAKAAIDPQSGIATCDSALQEQNLNRHDRAGTLVNRGVLKVALKRYQAAMDDYDAGIALEPDLGDAYVDRAGALIYLKRYDEALADIEHGMKLPLTYQWVAYYNRAVAEELMGRYKESYYDFKHVLELEPHFAPASERLKDFIVIRKPSGT